MGLKLVLLVVFTLFIMITALIVYTSARWRTVSDKLRAKLEAVRVPIRPTTYDAHEIEGLPPPVYRYFCTVLTNGQPMVSAVRLTQEGRFNRGETRAKWSRLTASQMTVTRQPGFNWDARIGMAPGLNVMVRDAYITGEGLLQVTLLGLATLAEIRGTPEMAQGELMRFLAEAPWCPTALLPSQGVRWEAIDDTCAIATLTDASTTVSLVFHFNSEGLISAARSPARHRMVNGAMIPTPWQGRFWNYEVRDGMRIPLEGEVSWELPEGLWPYWRCRIMGTHYDFAR